MLCQVEYARRIAKRTHRQLVVQAETGSPGLKHRFGQLFSEVFVFVDDRSNLEATSLGFVFTDCEKVFPKAYSTFGFWLDKSLQELTNGKEVQSRLVKNPPHKYQLAIHEGFGGGPDSFKLLEHVLLASDIFGEARRAIASVPPRCTAIHFRNSDYRSSFTNLSKVVSGIASEEPILIATDDKTIMKSLRTEFPSHTLLFASEILADYRLDAPTIRAVLELLLIAYCHQLVLIPLDGDNSIEPKYSGFGRLAKHLWSVRTVRQKGMSGYFAHLIHTALESPRRRRNFFRLAFFIALRAPELRRQAFAPKGVYLQMSQLA